MRTTHGNKQTGKHFPASYREVVTFYSGESKYIFLFEKLLLLLSSTMITMRSRTLQEGDMSDAELEISRLFLNLKLKKKYPFTIIITPFVVVCSYHK